MIWQLRLGDYVISFNEAISKNIFYERYSKYANNTQF